MAEITIDRPGWLDWGWALRVLAQQVRVPGEEVRAGEGVICTPYLLADGPAVVTVRASGPHLVLTPAGAAVAEQVTARFHLGLDQDAVTAALDRSALLGRTRPDRPVGFGWVRRPAAAGLWPYCVAFLCGGDADAAPVRRLFAELGQPAGALRLAPEPADLLTAGQQRLTGFGLAPHRAGNVLALARAFAASPDRYDETALRGRPAAEAIARVAELPHIGTTRARMIAAGALGHDDVLPDLSRRDEQLRAAGLSWPQVTAAARRAAPYRSVLADTLLELIAD